MKRKNFKPGRRGPVGLGIGERDFPSPQSMGAALGAQARNAPVPGYREGGRVRDSSDRIPARQMTVDENPQRSAEMRMPNAYRGPLEFPSLPDVGETTFAKPREIRLADGGMVQGYRGGRRERRYVEGDGYDKEMSAGAQARFREHCKGK